MTLTQVLLRDGDRRPRVHADARVVDELRRLVVDRDDPHVDHGGHARLGVRAGDQREAVAGGVAAVVDVLKAEEGGKGINEAMVDRMDAVLASSPSVRSVRFSLHICVWHGAHEEYRKIRG